jgi:hypothetical protein
VNRLSLMRGLSIAGDNQFALRSANIQSKQGRRRMGVLILGGQGCRRLKEPSPLPAVATNKYSLPWVPPSHSTMEVSHHPATSSDESRCVVAQSGKHMPGFTLGCVCCAAECMNYMRAW